MFIEKYKVICAVMVAFFGIAIQVALFICVGAKNVDASSSVELVRPTEYNINENYPQFYENTKSVDKSKNTKNIYFIKQTSKYSDYKKYEVDANNSKWHFAQSKYTNTEKWKNGIRQEQLIPNAVTHLDSKGWNEVPAAKPPTVANLDDSRQGSKPRSNLNLADNLRFVSKRETRGANFNNAKGVHVDQQLYINRTEIFGAYAEIYSEDDFSFTAGPEYSHSNEIRVGYGDSESSSDLSFGVQLKFGF